MTHERGQVMIEALAAVPVAVLCALALIDGASIVRDRIAVSGAASRAAVAAAQSQDMTEAAQRGMPVHLTNEMRVRDAAQVASREVTVTAISRPRVLRVPGGIEHTSSVELSAPSEEQS